MFSTIFADASHCSQTGAAGWGAWIKTETRASIQIGGQIDVSVGNSSEAELCAIRKAIEVAIARGYAPGGERNAFLIQSDSIRALSVMVNRGPAFDRPKGLATQPVHSLSPCERKTIAAIGTLASLHQVRLYVRHVKGHRPGSGRSWVNRACDGLARSAMRAAREARQ